MNIQRTVIAGMAMAVACGANADIARVGEFDSLQLEGFDNERWVFEREAQEIFGGMGQVFGEGGWIHTTGSWGYSNGDWRGKVQGMDGNFLGNTRGTIVYNFNETQHAFGGFFATNASVADGVIEFFDENDVVVGSSTVAAAVGGEWSWNGWSLDSGFTSIKVTSNYNEGDGGFLMHDSIRLSTATIPAPGALALLMTGGLLTTRRRNR